ncbi:MAG: hypothetical protein V7607_2589 [Solirubrobacteraceae bacterium]
MTAATHPDHAREAYDEFALHYDAFTADHNYDAWTSTLETLARRHGLRGRRMLDVACGTGKSFMPFLDRGYEVTACDVSPAMVRLARLKAGDRADVEVRDLRSLPALGKFDLVCCLDDALNYLLSPAEIARAMAGLRRNLAPGGVVVFDTNTLASYRTFFASLTVMPAPEQVVIWDGHASAGFGCGEVARATIDMLDRLRDGSWQRRRSVHYQRHYPRSVVEAALRDAGLRAAGVYGMRLDGSVTEAFAETDNSKAVYIARHDAHRR